MTCINLILQNEDVVIPNSSSASGATRVHTPYQALLTYIDILFQSEHDSSATSIPVHRLSFPKTTPVDTLTSLPSSLSATSSNIGDSFSTISARSVLGSEDAESNDADLLAAGTPPDLILLISLAPSNSIAASPAPLPISGNRVSSTIPIPPVLFSSTDLTSPTSQASSNLTHLTLAPLPASDSLIPSNVTIPPVTSRFVIPTANATAASDAAASAAAMSIKHVSKRAKPKRSKKPPMRQSQKGKVDETGLPKSTILKLKGPKKPADQARIRADEAITTLRMESTQASRASTGTSTPSPPTTATSVATNSSVSMSDPNSSRPEARCSHAQLEEKSLLSWAADTSPGNSARYARDISRPRLH